MTKIITEKAPAAIGPYSQAIQVDRFLFASGQIPIDPQTNLIAGDDIGSQAHQVMENIKGILEEAGFTFDHVVKTTCFLKDMGDFQEFNQIYAEYFTSLPARSCVAVKEIPKNVLCEVEITAYK